MSIDTVLRLEAAPPAVRAALHEAELLASCLPGSRLDRVDGRRAAGRLTLRLGGSQTTYRGELVAAEPSAGTLTASVHGTARGRGGLAGRLTLRLRPAGAGTELVVAGAVETHGDNAPANQAVERAVTASLQALGARLADALTPASARPRAARAAGGPPRGVEVPASTGDSAAPAGSARSSSGRGSGRAGRARRPVSMSELERATAAALQMELVNPADLAEIADLARGLGGPAPGGDALGDRTGDPARGGDGRSAPGGPRAAGGRSAGAPALPGDTRGEPPDDAPAVRGRVTVVTSGPIPASSVPAGDGAVARCRALVRAHPWITPVVILTLVALMLAARREDPRHGAR